MQLAGHLGSELGNGEARLDHLEQILLAETQDHAGGRLLTWCQGEAFGGGTEAQQDVVQGLEAHHTVFLVQHYWGLFWHGWLLSF